MRKDGSVKPVGKSVSKVYKHYKTSFAIGGFGPAVIGMVFLDSRPNVVILYYIAILFMVGKCLFNLCLSFILYVHVS